MAKKKVKQAEKAEPRRAQKKKPSAAGWVVGVIIVIVIIIAIILLLEGMPKTTEKAAPTAPAETPQAPVRGPTEVSTAPEQVRNCSINYAIGWPKNKLGSPCTVQGTKVTAQMMYSGKGDSLAGLWFQITTTDGTVKYLKDTMTVKQGDTQEYNVDVGQKIKMLLALPVISDGGVDKACLNQRLLIVKDTECVAG